MLLSHHESARERGPHERAWTQGPVYPKRMVGSSQRETRTTVTEGTLEHSPCTGQDVFCLTRMGVLIWWKLIGCALVILLQYTRLRVTSSLSFRLKKSHQQCLLCWRQQILSRELPTFTTPSLTHSNYPSKKLLPAPPITFWVRAPILGTSSTWLYLATATYETRHLVLREMTWNP